MNIFIIPSWYRSKKGPLGGIFFKEQVLILARLKPNWKFAISWNGYEDYTIPMNNPIRSLRNLIRFLKAKPSINKIAPNVWEFMHPALVWNDHFLGGNIRAIIRAHLKNFDKAESKLGRFNVIHALASIPAGFIAWEISSRVNIPFIISENIWPFSFYFNKVKLARAKKALRNASRVIAISNVVFGELKRLGVLNIEIIPNMVDENFFKPAKVKKNAPFTFFSLASILKQKGFSELLMAIKTVACPNICFRIGGAGKDLKKYQQLTINLGISQQIEWLGSLTREQALKEFQRADAFILPSYQESFGMVYTEAIACGLPVISTKCGGPQDIINSKNGILVPVKNYQKLSQAILEMTNNYARFSRKAIRKDFLANFSIKIVSKKLIKIYEEIQKAGSIS